MANGGRVGVLHARTGGRGVDVLKYLSAISSAKTAPDAGGVAHDDVRETVAIDVGQDWRTHKRPLWRRWKSLNDPESTLNAVNGVAWLATDGVNSALAVGHHDIEEPVAIEVADGRR